MPRAYTMDRIAKGELYVIRDGKIPTHLHDLKPEIQKYIRGLTNGVITNIYDFWLEEEKRGRRGSRRG